MTSSREAILARVRAAVRTAGSDAEAQRQSAAKARLAATVRHIVPARVADKSTDELVAVMRHWLQAAAAEQIEIADAQRLPQAVLACLAAHQLPPAIRMGTDAWLAALPWQDAPGLTVLHGRAEPADGASLTRALAAVAETGTMAVASGPDNPVTLSFLPDTAIVAVRRRDVVATLEEAFARLRADAAGCGLPRTLNLISGPSRSADIGGVPVLGAHGPRRLCVMVVG